MLFRSHHAAVFVPRESRIIAAMDSSPFHGMSESPEADSLQSVVTRWRWPMIALATALLLAIGSKYVRQRTSAMWKDHPAVGSQFNSFRLEPLTGGETEFTKNQLNDKVTLINFWGPWCHFCVEEFPHLQTLESRLRDRPAFQLVSVASAGDNDDQADEVQQLAKETQAFLNDRDATFPTYIDRKAALRMQYIRKSMEGGFGFPTTLVLDKTGTIRGVWAGYRPGDEQQIATLIEELLAL